MHAPVKLGQIRLVKPTDIAGAAVYPSLDGTDFGPIARMGAGPVKVRVISWIESRQRWVCLLVDFENDKVLNDEQKHVLLTDEQLFRLDETDKQSLARSH